MIINKHSKIILMVSATLTMNQKIYSAEQHNIRPTNFEITAPADSTNQTRSATNAATYSLIPDYGKNINSMAVAELNRQLQLHGYYEFSPETYLYITRQTQKYGLPIDVSFSRETQKAIVKWKKKNFFCFLPDREKINTFQTRQLPAADKLNINLPKIIKSKRQSTTPFLQPVSAHQQSAKLQTERSIFEKPHRTVPKQRTHFPITSQINSMQPHRTVYANIQYQPRIPLMTALQARDILHYNFEQFTEINQNHYIALSQSNQIITDLMYYGPARFETGIDRNNSLFLSVIWGRYEKHYKITYK